MKEVPGARARRQKQMIYNFTCDGCGGSEHFEASIKVGPPARVECMRCNCDMNRNWRADAPNVSTLACKNADDIPERQRVVRGGRAPASAALEEKKFHDHITQRRSDLRDGGNRGNIRHTHSVPADLYHGKIRQTGDKNYWQDPANMSRHKSCKVD